MSLAQICVARWGAETSHSDHHTNRSDLKALPFFWCHLQGRFFGSARSKI